MTLTGVFSLAGPYNNNCGNYPSCRQSADGVIRVFVVLAIVAFVCFLAWAIQQAVAHGRLEKRGTSATARIVSVEAKAGSRKSNAEVAVYLELAIPKPDGVALRHTLSASVPVLDPPKAGWTVPVRYLEYKSVLPRVELRGPFAPPALEPEPAESRRAVASRAEAKDASTQSAGTGEKPPAVKPLPSQPAATGKKLPAVKPLESGDPHSLGRFEVLGRIGVGGMGVVFLGRSRSGRLAAVKVVRPELADDAEFRTRFRREIGAARQVSGAFTAPVLDADPDADRPWLATLFVDAPSLRARVAADGPLPLDDVRTLGAGLAEALGELHRVGLVHRDVKPGNVLLAADGPRLIDFGIIRSDGLADLTESGIVLGSAGYMAPEQAEGKPTSPAADVFSLGAVLTFAATGHGPYGNGSAATLLARTITGEPDLSDLPEGLADLIGRCLARGPADRPGTDAVLDLLAG